ncbi:class I SAM-dependent DNA methyltransferase [Actinoplanes sp. CA-142083]|uniref:class I SAM-dependent DNA methyltransferase n=1 Tax=Actinoplanes sp. CA-142083 TaxID=3239903 RepID=UPI003D8FE216
MTVTQDPVATTYLRKTRIAYDVVAAGYTDMLSGLMADSTWDRSMLEAFSDLVKGPVVDVGCGPGRAAAFLADLDVDASGIDLSPRMVDIARHEHPGLKFEVGSLFEIDRPDASVAGLVAWYSLVHTPASLLPAAFAEFFRVLEPGGIVLVAFKVGDQRRALTCAYGHDVDLETYDYPVELMTDLLAKAGFEEQMRMVRAPEAREKQPQGYVVGVKPLNAADPEAVDGGGA